MLYDLIIQEMNVEFVCSLVV